MSPKEFDDIITELGFTPTLAAKFLGTTYRQVCRLRDGTHKVRPSDARFLRTLKKFAIEPSEVPPP